jgi:O-antigen/teichoic acid export membrane protein
MSFLKQSAATFVTQVVLMAVSMGTGIIVARVLGPEIKGQAALLGNLTQILFMCGSMGLGSAFSFFIAKKKYPARHIMTLALLSALLFGVLVNGAFYFSWPMHASMWAGIPLNLVILSTTLSILYIYSTYLVRIVVGHGRIYSMNVASTASTVTNLIAVILLLLVWSLGLYGVVFALWFGSIAQIFVLVWILRNDLVPAPCWNFDFIRATFSYGIKSHALLIINFLNYRLDIFLLQYITNDTIEVGYYSLAVGMAELMWLVPNSAVAPLFSGVAQSDTDDRSVITLRTCRWSLIFLVVLSVGGILLGRLFIRLLYGEQYLPSYAPFLWLLPGICLFPLFKLLIIDLAARGLPGYGTIASTIALVTNIGANIFLIPRFGGKGAAMATSLSYTLMACMSLVFFLKVTGYSAKDVFCSDKLEREFLRQAILNKTSRFLSDIVKKK